MSKFNSAVELDVSPSEGSLRDTRQTIESELGSLTVGVEPDTAGMGGAGGSLSTGVAAGSLAGTTDLLSEGVQLASERNTLLAEIRDFTERAAMTSSEGGGGGIASTLLPLGLLSSLGSGSLALTAASVLSVTGSLALAAGGVLSVTGYLGLNAKNVLAVTGALGVAATAALAFSGSLALTATGVLAMTGVLGLGAASVLAVSGVLGLDVTNVLAVTGSIGISAAAVMAVTGALSLPAAGVLAVTGVLSLALGDILDIKIGGGPTEYDYPSPPTGTATPGAPSPSELMNMGSESDASQGQELSPAELQERAMNNTPTSSYSPFGSSSATTQSTASSSTSSNRSNQARQSSQQQPEINHNPTYNVDFSKLERKIDRDLRKLRRKVEDLEDTVESATGSRL